MKGKGFVFALIFAGLVLSTVFLAGCANPQNNGTSNGSGSANVSQQNFKEIKRFENFKEMILAFKEAQNHQRNTGIFDKALGIVMIPLSAPMMAATSLGSSGAAESARGSADYSATNIQVQGVDEADIVKSDGRFIYNFSNNRLIITDAFPIDGSKIVSKTKLKEISPIEMFVSKDRLLIFGNKSGNYYDRPMPLSGKSSYPYYYRGGKVSVLLYDISERETPVLVKDFEFEGNYLASRLIGSNAFFVVNSFPQIYALKEATEENFIPKMIEDGVEKSIARPEEIGILPPMPPAGFVTIASLNLNTMEFTDETIAGSAQSVFASIDSIYISASAWLAQKPPVFGEAESAIWGDQEKTVINKFGLAGGKIGFLGQGSVPGHVLNQFSMDEFDGKFRIATTLGEVWSTAQQSKNNLYVLNEEMNTIGTLEGLAPGEKIYSARFLGNRAYLVTFKKVDPLFVIDLSDPANPQVLGKLKIPGYSDYLHPIDETHLIGVGKDTIDPSGQLLENRGFDFAWYQGLKLAIFDVSDVQNPKEMHKIIIGDRGTDSFALHDHKAFLYDREKELLVLPITLAEIPAEQKKEFEQEQMPPSYGFPVFQGAFVFRVTLENGFEERGRITHLNADEELKRGYYFGDESSVKRALFIENVLYTLSGKLLQANDLKTLEELKEFVFN